MDDDLIKRIVEYRGKFGLSQREFAIRCNLAMPTINAVEKGKKVTNLTRGKIEYVLNKKEEE